MPGDQVQDPWYTTNLKESYYFTPHTLKPVIELGLLGLLAGAFTMLFLFSSTDGTLANPFTHLGTWGLGLFFSAVMAFGTIRWGSARSWSGEAVRDVAIAVIGTVLSFALALVVLQLIRDTSSSAGVPLATAAAQRTTAFSSESGRRVPRHRLRIGRADDARHDPVLAEGQLVLARTAAASAGAAPARPVDL